MADAVVRAGPFALRPAHSHHSAPLSIAGAGVAIIAGILVLALGQQQHGPRKGRRQLCGVVGRQPGPGYWAWPGV
jgi:hypothetical protein